MLYTRAGVVTSMMDPDAASSPFGLAYIKTKAGGVGLKVRVIVSLAYSQSAHLVLATCAHTGTWVPYFLALNWVWKSYRVECYFYVG